MGVLDLLSRVNDALERAFVTGPAVVDPAVVDFGAPSEWSPSEYGDYIATSNGVYACVRLRATNLASLPLRLYSENAESDRIDLPRTHEAVRLFRTVNPFWTFKRLTEMTEMSMGLWGQAFWVMAMRGNRPAELWWARPDRMTVHPHPSEYISHFTYDHGGREIRFERDEVAWIRYPNPLDEFSGLSPLAAARLAADTSTAAMKSNYMIFRNGVQAAALIAPAQGATMLTDEQAKTLTDQINRRMKGIDNAHRIGVLRFDVDVKQLSMTPEDAQYLGSLDWNLQDIARAYGIPIDKIGGKRTHENVEESDRAFWADTMKPEAELIAAEITEQILPKFGPNLVAEFDLSGVDVLHEAESARWERERGMIEVGRKTINEIREENGEKPVPWGNVWWAQSTLMPIDSEEKPVAPVPPALAANAGQGGETDPEEDDDETAERRVGAANTRTIAYGSDEHRRLWQRQLDRAEPWEALVATTTTQLLLDQQQSVLARLRQRGIRAEDAVAMEPFDRSRWIKAFRTEIRPALFEIATQAAALELDELGVPLLFDVQDPNVIRAMERQAQRFAEQVNQTTWNDLRASIAEGIAEGEDIDAIAERVLEVMRDRIRSSKETIARTEVTTASTTGTLASWDQSGVVQGKQWLAALDDRTRKSHVDAHGQTVGINDDFHVGGAVGPGPGNMGSAREDINCRCSLVPVIDTEIPTVTLED